MQRRLLLARLTLLSIFVLTTPLLAPEGLAAEGDPVDRGPSMGEEAPDFTLVDQQGRAREFASLLGRGKLAIVFFRSADW